MMIQIYQNYQLKCEELLKDEQFRFVGIINKLGNLIAGGFSHKITPFETEEKSRMMYMQMVLEISMRKDFDETLGEIDYIASKRKNALMISIPINDELLLISTNPKEETKEIVAKAIKIFRSTEERYEV